MLRTGSLVKKSLHLLAFKPPGKHPSVPHSQLRRNSVQYERATTTHTMATQENPVGHTQDQDEIYRHMERLSLANLKTFIEATRCQTKDLERLSSVCSQAREVTKEYSFSGDSSIMPELHQYAVHTNSKSEKFDLDGKALDKLFNIETDDYVTKHPVDMCNRSDAKSFHLPFSFEWTSMLLNNHRQTEDLGGKHCKMKAVGFPKVNTSPEIPLEIQVENSRSSLYLHEKCSTELSQELFQNTLLCSSGAETPSPSEPQSNKPTYDQLKEMQDYLIDFFPKAIFHKQDDWTLYDQDVVLQNNFDPDKPVTIKGIKGYVLYVTKVRIYLALKYALTSVFVENTWLDVEKATIKIHWRMTVLTQLQSLMFWKLNPFKPETVKKTPRHTEAISTFHLNKDGKINYHVIDRTRLDDELAGVKVVNPLEKLIKKQTAPV